MLDAEDQICWCRVWDAGDKSRHQNLELGTNIKYPSPTSHRGVLKIVKKYIEFGNRLNFMCSTYYIGHQHHILAYMMLPNDWNV